MQTKMIAKYIEVTHRCPECKFKLTTRGGVYDSAEFFDKILHKVKREDNICTICKKGILELMYVRCEVKPIINENCYEIKWKCGECGAIWYSIENLNPKEATFNDKFNRVKNTKTCINEDCASHKVKVLSLIYHRKI